MPYTPVLKPEAAIDPVTADKSIQEPSLTDRIKGALGFDTKTAPVESAPAPISGYTPVAPKTAPQKDVALKVGYTPVSAPKPGSNDYFYKQFESGATIGKSDEFDTSGRPLFAYRKPGDVATTTDKTRIATKFDPTVATPLTHAEYYNPRSEGLREKFHDQLGIKSSDELDHAIALTVGGSNLKENLRAIPAEQNQEAGGFEMDLARQLKEGTISYLDAQILDAKHKGIAIPYSPTAPKVAESAGMWDSIKNRVKGMFASEPAPVATSTPTTTPAKGYTPVKAPQAAAPTTVQPDYASLTTESTAIGDEQKKLEQAALKVDKTDQASIDAFNKQVKTFNDRVHTFQETATQYNKSLPESPAVTAMKGDGSSISPNKGGGLKENPNEPTRGQKFATTVAQTEVDAVKEMQSRMNKLVAEETNFSIDKATKTVSTLMGIVNVAFSPITGAMKASEELPGIGSLVKVANKVFEGVGTIAAFNADKIVGALPISDQNKEKIKPVAEELLGLLAQVALGKVTHDIAAPKINEYVSRLKTLSSEAITNLTKDRTVTIMPAQRVFIHPDTIRDYIAGRQITDVEKTDLYKTLGRTPDQIRKDVKNGIEMEVPERVIETLKDKPYWSRIKELFTYEYFKSIPNTQGGFVKNPFSENTAKDAGNSEKPKIPAYEGSTDLTTPTLDKLKGRSTVSKQFISNLTNSGDLKQAERELIREVLADYPDGKDVPVKEFADKVQSELLPLSRNAASPNSNPRYESVNLPDEERGNVANYEEKIYSSPIKTAAGDVHFPNRGGYGSDSYFAHSRIEDVGTPHENAFTGEIKIGKTDTRRVIELQSDLFQKGRLEGEMNKTMERFSGKYNFPEDYSKNKITGRKAEIARLEPYRNTWHERVIREEIKQAAKDGKTKLQFPTGETALKIEGLGGNGREWAIYDGTNGNIGRFLKKEDLKVGQEVKDGANQFWVVTDVLGDGKFKAVPKDVYQRLQKVDQVQPNNKWVAETPGGVREAFDSKEEAQKWLMGTREESFDISGKVDTNNPIYKFYEKEVGRYLKNKYDAKKITDKQDVSWYEVDVPKELAEKPVQAFKSTTRYYPLGRGPKIEISKVADLLAGLVPKDKIQYIFNPDLIKNESFLGEFRSKSNMRALNPKIKPVIELFRDRNGKTYARTAFHEASHFIDHEIFQPSFLKKLNEDTLAKMTEGDHNQYNHKIYKTPEARAEEYRADENAKEWMSKAGYKSKIHTILERVRAAIRRIIAVVKKVTGADIKEGRQGGYIKNPLEEKVPPEEAFKKSTEQKVVGIKGDTTFEIGSYGRNALERKLEAGKEDRLPQSELSNSLKYIKKDYIAGKTSFRKDNIIHVAEMPNGEKRAIVTRENAKGNAEVINFFKIGKDYKTFIENLESFGTLGGIRTHDNLFRRETADSAGQGKSNLPEPKKEIKSEEPTEVSVSGKGSRAELEAANRKYIAHEVKSELEKGYEKALSITKADPELEKLNERLSILQDALETDLAKELIKYTNKKTGELPQVTGEGKSVYAQYGDDIVTELGIKNTDEAPDRIEKVRELQRKIKEVRRDIQLKKFEVRDKVKEIQDEEVLSKMAARAEKHIGKIIGDEANKKAHVERALAAEKESAKKLADEADSVARRKTAVQKAHIEARRGKGFIQKLKSTFGPIANTDAVSRRIWEEWTAKRILAKEEANRTMEDFVKRGFGDINDINEIMEYQAGKKTPWIRNFYDSMWTEGRRRGLDTYYREDYFTQVYKEPAREIKEKVLEFLTKEAGLSKESAEAYVNGDEELPEYVAIRLKMTPSFERTRVFPDYTTAFRYGLTPRFLTIPEHFAYYRGEMEKVIANQEMIQDYIKNHKFLDSDDAPAPWIEIKVPGQGRRKWYASPDLANALNKQFQLDAEETLPQFFARIGSNVNSLMTNIVLAGGLPYTPINYFAVAQAIRALTTSLGAVAKFDIPVAKAELAAAYSLIRSFSQESSIKWFRENLKYIEMMGKHNISLESRAGAYDDIYNGLKSLVVRTPGNRQALVKDVYQSIVDGKNTLLSKEGMKHLFGFTSDKNVFELLQRFSESKGAQIGAEQYNNAFNRKTFQVMMPMMQIQIFKDMYNTALKGGLQEEEASAYAAQIVKSEFGISNRYGRSLAVQNTINTFAMAPRFRESLINSFANTIKGSTAGIKNPAYRNNRAFAVGAILSFVIYQLINQAINNEFTWDNEDGRKFSIKVPLPNGEIGYVEYLPSIFATPRMLVQSGLALAQGNLAEAAHQISGFFAMPINLAADDFTNRDHFNRPIYKDTDTPVQKATAAVAHLGTGFVHPYFKEFTKYFTGGEPLYQALSIMAEIPVKYSNVAKESQAKFYDQLAADKAKRAKELVDFKSTYDKIRAIKNTQGQSAGDEQYDKLSTDEKDLYQSLKKSEATKDTKAREAAIYSTVKTNQDLKAAGRQQDADKIYNALSDEDKKAYASVRKRSFKE